MATRKGLNAAGIGALPDESMPGVWSTYFAVDDADATAAKVKEAGGSLMMECFDVMEAGRMAFAADPNGAIFGIWQAKGHFGAGIVNEHGTLNWNELLSDNLGAGLDFYATVFGHTHETAQMPNGPYTSFAVGDSVIAGAMPKPDPEIPNNWGVYFAVDDTAEAMKTAKAYGGHVTYGPLEIPDVGVFAGLADPYGANFTVIQLAQPMD
jgi:predicted enzyme related to lactoylglutathione lyase